jgi:hypothetical protein
VKVTSDHFCRVYRDFYYMKDGFTVVGTIPYHKGPDPPPPPAPEPGKLTQAIKTYSVVISEAAS